MCTGGEIAMLALAAGGTAASMEAQNQANAERKRAVLQGLNDEAAIGQRQQQRTDELVQDTYDPTKRAANYEQAAQKTEASLGDLLTKQAAAGQGSITDATSGAVSDAYTRAKAQRTADTAQQSRTLARMLSRTGAMGGLYDQEALKGADYSSDMMGLGVESRMARNRANNRYGGAGAAGQDLALLGGLMSGVAPAAGGMGSGRGSNGTIQRNAWET